MLTVGALGVQKRKAAAVRGGLQRTGADGGWGTRGFVHLQAKETHRGQCTHQVQPEGKFWGGWKINIINNKNRTMIVNIDRMYHFYHTLS